MKKLTVKKGARVKVVAGDLAGHTGKVAVNQVGLPYPFLVELDPPHPAEYDERYAGPFKKTDLLPIA